MGYFGGLGAGKGWRKFSFFVEPDLLQDALLSTGATLLVTNTTVSTDYVETTISEYAELYADHLADAWAGRMTWRNLHISLVLSGVPVEQLLVNDPSRKLIRPLEPPLGLADESVSLIGSRFATNCSPGVFFGLQSQIPKVWFTKETDWEVANDGQALRMDPVFTALQTWISARTSPCTLESAVGVHRTRIRVCPAIRERLRNYPALEAKGLRIR